MFSRIFSKHPQRATTPTGSIPFGERVYAIGDIHGRLDLLKTLLAKIEEDNAGRASAKTQIIFLGDLIDRGPKSAQVIQLAFEFEQANPNAHFLLGNHEEVFLKALGGDLKALAFFNRIGGRETIFSYGISEEVHRAADYPALLELLLAKVPGEHIAFLKRFEDLIIVGDYAFVHAGIRPETPLANQRTSDLRWIRDEFLDHPGALEKVVVHGHTITEEVEYGSHRIGLDTGAYASHRLTAMGFEHDQRWVLATGDAR